VFPALRDRQSSSVSKKARQTVRHLFLKSKLYKVKTSAVRPSVPSGLRYAPVCHVFCFPSSSSLQLPVFFSLASRSFVAKLKKPSTAVLGSPANSLGSPLSQFLSLRTKHPSRKSKTPPKPQRKRHASFRLLRQLSPSGLGHTRSRLAHSVCKPLRSCLTPLFCSHYPNAGSRLFYLRTVPYYQQFVTGEG